MVAFFKSIGKGIRNIFFIPFFIVILAISAVAGIVVFFIELINKIIRFVTGRPLNKDLPEDIEAKRLIDKENGIEDANDEIETVRAVIEDPKIQQPFAPASHQIENEKKVDLIVEEPRREIEHNVDSNFPEIPSLDENNSSDNNDEFFDSQKAGF